MRYTNIYIEKIPEEVITNKQKPKLDVRIWKMSNSVTEFNIDLQGAHEKSIYLVFSQG